ncbi:uncharacterized protein N7459_005490 [Penicillium hispanicum]|uniref:uncharacterized protein n=1 Tax=Penicillium hispanicum TaxID=1080232 RepID=UPI00254252A3|nr:uncharacterized protein N7459_005490 [Penicillium hispanicum]KAJ5579505.1 hypothetical protein N7459_005490 [Penicillium hispanicum]
MGGAPWQSLGCQACKKRKIKKLGSDADYQCDLEEPGCSRCTGRGIPCPGYDTDRFFRYEASTRRQQHGKREAPTIKSRPGVLIRTRSSVLGQDVSPSPGMRMQIASAFINSYFPSDMKGSTGVDAWHYLISSFATLPNKSDMFEKAIATICCVYLGKMNHDEAMLRQGVRLCNSAMRQVGSMIQKNVVNEETLYMTVIFRMLAVTPALCPTLACIHELTPWNLGDILPGWRASNICPFTWHACPSKILLSKFADESSHYGHLQYTPVLRGTGELFRYLIQPASNSPVEQLFEIFIGICSLFGRLDKADQSDKEACRQFFQACLSHRETLLTWYSRRKEALGGKPSPYTAGVSPSASLPVADHLFGPTYSYPSIDCARLHTIFWLGMICMEPLVHQARTLLLTHEEAPLHYSAVTSSDQEYASLVYYTDQICRTVPFFLQDGMRLWGAHTVVGTLGQVCRAYTHLGDRRKFLWCLQALRLIVSRGFDVAIHVIDLSWDYWNRFHGSIGNPVPKSFLEDIPVRLFENGTGDYAGKIAATDRTADGSEERG